MSSASNSGGEKDYFPIDAELYQHLVTGNLSDFDQLDGSFKLRRCARDMSTILHIASSFGHVHLVNLVLNQCPQLMVIGNSFGDLPIHSAIKTGRLNTTVQAMIKWLKENNNQIEIGHVLGVINEEGNTPLHCSLELYDVEDYQTVVDLVELYPRAAYAMNKQGVCPLFLAIKREILTLVKLMLYQMQFFNENEVLQCLMKGQSIVHAAVAATTLELLGDNDMLYYIGKLNDLMHEGRSALSYAASLDYLEKVEILIRIDPSSAFISNADKTFAIHVAVLGGYTRIVNLLTSSRFLLNAKGQNIFHLAALTGDSNMVSYLILNLSDVEFLINQKDEDGNTPLHLATRDQQIEVVEILIHNEKVNGRLVNKQGLTACDLAKNKLTVSDDANKEMVQRLNFMFKREAMGLKCSISPIDEDLYQSLLRGDMDQVDETISARGIQFKDLGYPTNGDTILHIFASMGKHQLLEQVLHPNRGCGDLREQANNNGDLPIHLAAKTGNLKSVQALFIWPDNREVNTRICLKQNMEGDTALHVAVQNNHREVAKGLYNYCPNAAYYLNKNKICPLFLAIKNWYNEIDMVNPMIRGLQNNMQFIEHDAIGMRSIIHVAITTRKIDILKSLTHSVGNLFKHTFDDKGRNPLSYAICIGYMEGVQLLLDNFPALEFKRDQDEYGSFPIHQAAKKGNIKIIKMLTLSICLLNNKQQNILHVAAAAGNSNVVNYLLKRQDRFEELLNTGDANGNTPLHLASKGCYTKTMLCLMWKKQIDCNSLNKELRTARDDFEMSSQYSTADERLRVLINLVDMLFWIKGGDIKYYFRGKRDKECNGNEVKKEEGKQQPNVKTRSWTESSSVNILLVVATVIVSVTYTTTFNPPGGYKQDTGIPSLISSKDFEIFMDLNSSACFFALTSAIMLLVIPLPLIPYHVKLLKVASVFLIFYGLLHMSFGYARGLTLVTPHSSEMAKTAPFVAKIVAFYILFWAVITILTIILVNTKKFVQCIKMQLPKLR